MSRKKTARLRILLLTMTVSSIASAQTPIISPKPDRSAASITITPDNVELYGAGSFQFRPDGSAFEIDSSIGESGVSLSVLLWFDPLGHAVSCDTGSNLSSKLADAACAQLMRSATFQIFPGMSMPLHRGFINVEFSFYNQPKHGSSNISVYALPSSRYSNVLINYPPDETKVPDRLSLEDGHFTTAVQADDYPPDAIRNKLESLSVVRLGFDRSGHARSCRPVGDGGGETAFLDNYTCALFMKRAKFEFAPGYPQYEGLRYLTRRARWKIPQTPR